MPIFKRTRPSFTSSPSSARDSFDLPDYYRTTKLEKYGPYYRTSEPACDFMTTIDLRGEEGAEFEFDSPLPDIFEEEEEDDHDAEPEEPDAEPIGENREKRVSWISRLLSALRKCYIHKVGTAKLKTIPPACPTK